jgi:hypothetical protein
MREKTFTHDRQSSSAAALTSAEAAEQAAGQARQDVCRPGDDAGLAGHLMARGKRRINQWRKQIIMNLFTVRRNMAKVEYRAMRLPLALLEECVVARYWQEEAFFRLGFERFLGSLDEIAGWLLADDDISERGQALMRTKAQPRRAQADENLHAGQEQARQARGQAHEEADDKIAAAYQREQEDQQQVRREASAPATAYTAQAEHAAGKRAADQPDTPVKPAAKAGTVDVTFTLPAEVQASTVALCGEFNQWSAEDIRLQRGSDGCWRATVALEPGHSYRYRYLLDGERWENAWQADRYAPNSFGGDDSVIFVG